MDNILRSTAITGTRRLKYGSNRDQIESPKKETHPQSAEERGTVDEPTLSDIATANLVHSADIEASGTDALHDEEEEGQSSRQYIEQLAELRQENTWLRERLFALEDSDAKEAVEKEVYEQGYQSGLEKGEAEARQQIEQGLEALQNVISEIDLQSQAAWTDIQHLSVDLSWAIVCKLLGDRALDTAVVRSLAEKVIASTREGSTIRILLSPKDYRLIKAADPDAQLIAGRPIALEQDATIELGGCIVETDYGSWDGRLETQLRHLRNEIEQALSGSKS